MLLLGLALATTVSPEQTVFPVHAKVSIRFRVEAGPEGLNPGDVLTVDEPVFHGMRWAKWGYLQTDAQRCNPLSEDTDKASAGLVRASAEGLELDVRHSVNGPGIHEEGQVRVEIVDGALVEGEALLIELGVEEGDCGWQTSDRALDRILLPVKLNAELVGIVPVRFEAHPEVVETRTLLPSQGLAGEPVEVRVVELDRYGNALSVTFTEQVFDVGVHRVNGSNPIRVTAEPPSASVYWGDLHTHHGHSYALDGVWYDANHAYSRDVMGFDFGCESAKAFPTELRYEDLWERMQRSCAEYTVDGDYVAFLGFEWMGGGTQGHHNVYLSGCTAELAPQSLANVDELLGWMPSDAVAVPHASSYTGFNWETRDDTLRPLVEVYSEWGSSMDPSVSGSVPEALVRGQKLGFIASSDNHDGWLGNRLAFKNAPGGLAAIVAPELSTAALLDAMRGHSTYATTGARILLDFSAEARGQDTQIAWSAHGTDVLREVHLVASTVQGEAGVRLHTWYPETLDAEGTYRLPWGPKDIAVWLEVGQVDREQAWSSPAYIERTPPASPGCSTSPTGLLLLPLILAFLCRR